MVGVLRLWATSALAAVWLSAAYGSEFFVSPSGDGTGDGSRSKPWDLATALEHPPAIKPGDTVWLLGGSYTGGFTCRLRGNKEAPIVVRQALGQRAIIDCRKREGSANFVVEGDWVTFWGFEMTCTDPRRTTTLPGHGDMNRGGIVCRASHVRFVNLVIHDTGGAVGFWSEAEGGEIYGCLLYHNGWRGPERGHGHAIYAQNRTGTKRFVDNVLFEQFGAGLHVYGSQTSSLRGFHIEGNVSFDNGSLAGQNERSVNFLVGGVSPAEGIALIENYAYNSIPAAGTAAQLGYFASNRDLVCRENYFHGLTRILLWDRVEMQDNTFVGPNNLIWLQLAGEASTRYSWNRNTYLSTQQQHTVLYAERDGEKIYGWPVWREKLNFDVHGTYSEGPPQDVKVFVRPNRYERGRAHVIVYNWNESPSVDVDLSKVVDPGQRFRIFNVRNTHGQPVVDELYRGDLVRLPMEPTAPELPIGMPDCKLPVPEPRFGVFLVLPGPNDAN
jgi:hypothetical protein